MGGLGSGCGTARQRYQSLFERQRVHRLGNEQEQLQQKCDGRTTNQRAKKLTPSCDHAPAANQPAGVPGSRPGPAQAPSPERAARIQLGPKAAVREMSGAVPILERERVQSTVQSTQQCHGRCGIIIGCDRGSIFIGIAAVLLRLRSFVLRPGSCQCCPDCPP